MNSKPLFRNLIATILFLVFFAPVKAQLTHSIGATLPFGLRTYSVSANSKNTDAYYLAMFSYGFRYNLTELDNSSFSIGPLISAGGGVSEDGFLYSGDLQAWADYNIGMGAVQDPAKNTGAYFGAGFGGSYTGVDGDAIDDDNGLSFGPMLRAGFRFGVMDTPIGIGVYYKHGLENAKWKTFGFHVLVDF